MTLLLVALGCAAPRVAERQSPVVGRTLALTAPGLDGRVVDVAAQTGKVRVIDFWATWCEPCKEALPQLDALARELGPRGLAVYGVAVDDDRQLIVDFLRRTPVGFPVLWDRGGAQAARFDATFMPVAVVVDRRGVIRHVHQGWDPRRAGKERQQIEALLAEQ